MTLSRRPERGANVCVHERARAGSHCFRPLTYAADGRVGVGERLFRGGRANDAHSTLALVAAASYWPQGARLATPPSPFPRPEGEAREATSAGDERRGEEDP